MLSSVYTHHEKSGKTLSDMLLFYDPTRPSSCSQLCCFVSLVLTIHSGRPQSVLPRFDLFLYMFEFDGGVSPQPPLRYAVFSSTGVGFKSFFFPSLPLSSASV